MKKDKKALKLISSTVLQNKKAKFNYSFIETETAGIKLFGTEIKSIRSGKASITEAYIFIDHSNQVWLKGMHISIYDKQGYTTHEPDRDKLLLLTKKQAEKWKKEVDTTSLTIVPILGSFNENGIFKIEIALAKGKKLYDKRNSIKERDNERSLSLQTDI